MKSLVLVLSLFVASSSFAQISTTVTSHRFGIKLHGVGAAPAMQKVAPLNAKLGFSIDIPVPYTTITPGSQDSVITGTITNLTNANISLNFHRTQHLPIGWTTGVCFGIQCLVASADSGQKPFVFAAHEAEAFVLHFYGDDNSHLSTNQDTVLVNLIVNQVGGTPADTIQLHLKGLISTTAGVAQKNVLPTTPTIASVYPNPIVSSTDLSAQIFLPAASQGSVAVYGVRGNLVRSESNLALQKGVNVVRFDVAGLASGSYQLVCTLPSSVKITRAFEISR